MKQLGLDFFVEWARRPLACCDHQKESGGWFPFAFRLVKLGWSNEGKYYCGWRLWIYSVDRAVLVDAVAVVDAVMLLGFVYSLNAMRGDS